MVNENAWLNRVSKCSLNDGTWTPNQNAAQKDHTNPSKIIASKTKCTKPKSIKKLYPNSTASTLNLKISRVKSAQLEGSHGAALSHGYFIMSTLENLPNPDGTVCEKNNGMDVEGPLEIYCIQYTVVSSSSFFTITSLPAKLRKVCCLTSSFKTKPALISLYLTTCWKEVAMRLEILKFMGLLVVC